MDTPYCFFRLLVKGSYLNDNEKNTVRTIYDSFGMNCIYEIVKEKKIIPFAANTFCNCMLDVDFWSNILRHYQIRNKAILLFLNKVYTVLHEQGVRKMFVTENFGALLSADEDIGLFSSGDIDNYAAPNEKEKIYNAFEILGCARKERFSGAHQIAAEFFPAKKEGLPDNFYFSVDFYPLARLKLPCFVQADDFINWDKIYAYKNTEIILPPTDALMYICLLHISLHSYSRAPDIRLYVDLMNMFHTDIEYTNIIKWCIHDKTCKRVAVSAELSNWLVETRFQNDIIELSKNRLGLEKMVYDFKKRDLRYAPDRLKILLIEMKCNDSNMLVGLKNILFPNKEWVKKVYMSCGLKAYLLHIIKLLR